MWLNGKTVVLLQGAFDIINRGHVKAFEWCKQYWDHLIIALNSDELLKRYKWRDAVLPRYQKKFIIENIRFVDEVIKADNESPMELLQKHDVDVYAVTEDRMSSHPKEIEWIKNKWGKIINPPYFDGVIHTSEIKKRLLDEYLNEQWK
jgi:glycerol-3-phosphate cytidylyltransferase-like family protein